MAIYKPSNLSPQNEEIDLGEENRFSCQVNTSGESVVGYKACLYNNDGTQKIYEGSHIDLDSPVKNGRLLKTDPIGTKEILNNKIPRGTKYYTSSDFSGEYKIADDPLEFLRIKEGEGDESKYYYKVSPLINYALSYIASEKTYIVEKNDLIITYKMPSGTTIEYFLNSQFNEDEQGELVLVNDTIFTYCPINGGYYTFESSESSESEESNESSSLFAKVDFIENLMVKYNFESECQNYKIDIPFWETGVYNFSISGANIYGNKVTMKTNGYKNFNADQPIIKQMPVTNIIPSAIEYIGITVQYIELKKDIDYFSNGPDSNSIFLKTFADSTKKIVIVDTDYGSYKYVDLEGNVDSQGLQEIILPNKWEYKNVKDLIIIWLDLLDANGDGKINMKDVLEMRNNPQTYFPYYVQTPKCNEKDYQWNIRTYNQTKANSNKPNTKICDGILGGSTKKVIWSRIPYHGKHGIVKSGAAVYGDKECTLPVKLSYIDKDNTIVMEQSSFIDNMDCYYINETCYGMVYNGKEYYIKPKDVISNKQLVDNIVYDRYIEFSTEKDVMNIGYSPDEGVELPKAYPYTQRKKIDWVTTELGTDEDIIKIEVTDDDGLGFSYNYSDKTPYKIFKCSDKHTIKSFYADPNNNVNISNQIMLYKDSQQARNAASYLSDPSSSYKKGEVPLGWQVYYDDDFTKLARPNRFIHLPYSFKDNDTCTVPYPDTTEHLYIRPISDYANQNWANSSSKKIIGYSSDTGEIRIDGQWDNVPCNGNAYRIFEQDPDTEEFLEIFGEDQGWKISPSSNGKGYYCFPKTLPVKDYGKFNKRNYRNKVRINGVWHSAIPYWKHYDEMKTDLINGQYNNVAFYYIVDKDFVLGGHSQYTPRYPNSNEENSYTYKDEETTTFWWGYSTFYDIDDSNMYTPDGEKANILDGGELVEGYYGDFYTWIPRFLNSSWETTSDTLNNYVNKYSGGYCYDHRPRGVWGIYPTHRTEGKIDTSVFATGREVCEAVKVLKGTKEYWVEATDPDTNKYILSKTDKGYIDTKFFGSLNNQRVTIKPLEYVEKLPSEEEAQLFLLPFGTGDPIYVSRYFKLLNNYKEEGYEDTGLWEEYPGKYVKKEEIVYKKGYYRAIKKGPDAPMTWNYYPTQSRLSEEEQKLWEFYRGFNQEIYVEGKPLLYYINQGDPNISLIRSGSPYFRRVDPARREGGPIEYFTLNKAKGTKDSNGRIIYNVNNGAAKSMGMLGTDHSKFYAYYTGKIETWFDKWATPGTGETVRAHYVNSNLLSKNTNYTFEYTAEEDTTYSLPIILIRINGVTKAIGKRDGTFRFEVTTDNDPTQELEIIFVCSQGNEAKIKKVKYKKTESTESFIDIPLSDFTAVEKRYKTQVRYDESSDALIIDANYEDQELVIWYSFINDEDGKVYYIKGTDTEDMDKFNMEIFDIQDDSSLGSEFYIKTPQEYFDNDPYKYQIVGGTPIEDKNNLLKVLNHNWSGENEQDYKIFIQPNINILPDEDNPPELCFEDQNIRIDLSKQYLSYYQNGEIKQKDITFNKLDDSQWLIELNKKNESGQVPILIKESEDGVDKYNINILKKAYAFGTDHYIDDITFNQIYFEKINDESNEVTFLDHPASIESGAPIIRETNLGSYRYVTLFYTVIWDYEEDEQTKTSQISQFTNFHLTKDVDHVNIPLPKEVPDDATNIRYKVLANKSVYKWQYAPLEQDKDYKLSTTSDNEIQVQFLNLHTNLRRFYVIYTDGSIEHITQNPQIQDEDLYTLTFPDKTVKDIQEIQLLYASSFDFDNDNYISKQDIQQYKDLTSYNFIPQTPYTVYTDFMESSPNAYFYARTTPTLGMLYNQNGFKYKNYSIATKKINEGINAYFTGTVKDFSPQIKCYKYILYSCNHMIDLENQQYIKGGKIKDSGYIYNNDFTWEYAGLQNNQYYIVRFVIEDQFNKVFEKEWAFQAKYQYDRTFSSLSVNYDCLENAATIKADNQTLVKTDPGGYKELSAVTNENLADINTVGNSFKYLQIPNNKALHYNQTLFEEEPIFIPGNFSYIATFKINHDKIISFKDLNSIEIGDLCFNNTDAQGEETSNNTVLKIILTSPYGYVKNPDPATLGSETYIQNDQQLQLQIKNTNNSLPLKTFNLPDLFNQFYVIGENIKYALQLQEHFANRVVEQLPDPQKVEMVDNNTEEYPKYSQEYLLTKEYIQGITTYKPGVYKVTQGSKAQTKKWIPDSKSLYVFLEDSDNIKVPSGKTIGEILSTTQFIEDKLQYGQPSPYTEDTQLWVEGEPSLENLANIFDTTWFTLWIQRTKNPSDTEASYTIELSAKTINI